LAILAFFGANIFCAISGGAAWNLTWA